jgi:DNA-binding NtrC family response regulator
MSVVRPILIVDDEPVARESLAAWLREDGYPVETAASGAEALERARGTDYEVYFIDLKMPPGADGIETMKAVLCIRPQASIVIITAHATVDTAILAMKEGAQDYLVKPFNPEGISLLLRRLLKVKTLERENVILRKRLERKQRFGDLISKNPQMHAIFDLIRQVAGTRSTILIQGESGTGKELLARAIHNESDRAGGPFVAVACAALAETLLESELFGYERGAFTGAVGQKKGKLELAHGGTLFLDEIGDISPKLQVDLLRFLQERSFCRVGGAREVPVDVRVIAATNLELQQAVREGRFRQELFYRLNVINIRLPPLADRREDIPLLASHFIETFGPELGKRVEGVSDGALRILMGMDWPGNVRELENAVERALVTCRSTELGVEDFQFLVGGSSSAAGWVPPADVPLKEVERQVILATLQRNGGNIRQTASVLGIDRSTLYEKLKRYGVATGD